jgi:hypothetical protein
MTNPFKCEVITCKYSSNITCFKAGTASNALLCQKIKYVMLSKLTKFTRISISTKVHSKFDLQELEYEYCRPTVLFVILEHCD